MLRILTLLAVLLLSACTIVDNTPRPAQPPGVLLIERIEVEVRESDPVQVVAVVQGWLGDGCTTIGPITQERDGAVIQVTLGAVHSGAEVCTAIAPAVNEQIVLEGDFPPGEYLLEIQGEQISFSV
jgi:hypothetical protein